MHSSCSACGKVNISVLSPIWFLPSWFLDQNSVNTSHPSQVWYRMLRQCLHPCEMKQQNVETKV
jgi:hypothetical protein